MNIAILGTRGVPNYYGGFEQLAEYLCVGLVQKGHAVTVYNSHNHPNQASEWQGVTISHQFDPEHKLGTAGQFIYDLNCIRHARTQNYNIILQLGYTSSSVWSKLFPNHSTIVTNMDGLEWKRSKYSYLTKKFLRFAEKLAVQHSHALIADSIGIQKYLHNTYQAPSTYIPYGAHLLQEKSQTVLEDFGVSPFGYDLLIARLEPENSIETILKGLVASSSKRVFLVVGGLTTPLGKQLKKQFPDKRIKFLGAIYDISILNNLRAFSNLYFHGHTVGGTNPSLLEAMSSDCLICAHNNEFNSHILGPDAYYFENIEEVKSLLETKSKSFQGLDKIEKNRHKIASFYTWDKIVNQYEECFQKALTTKK